MVKSASDCGVGRLKFSVLSIFRTARDRRVFESCWGGLSNGPQLSRLIWRSGYRLSAALGVRIGH